MHANAGRDAYETPWHGRIKGATKTKSECKYFPLTLRERIKGAPAYLCIFVEIRRWFSQNPLGDIRISAYFPVVVVVA